jgi:ABC-type nitrate/sulfonate/bicarbonate transport system substrate-binding protein
MNWKTLFTTGVLAAATLSAPAHAADKIRIGYWSSGVSLGFGSVLEAQPFMKDLGIDVEYVHFPDVNAPLRALAANSIDLAFGAPAAGVFSAASDGVPIKIFAATQPADVQFVVPEGSPIKSLNELRGKKIGMSPAGSSVAVIATTVLAGNAGIKPNDFSLVGGNESRLAQFLVQKQVDAAALRSVTIEQLDELKVTSLGSFASEWQKLTKTDAVPYIGVGAVRSDYLQKNPDAVAKVIAGLLKVQAWGGAHPAEVAALLKKSANLPEKDAKAYANQWNQMYRLSFEPADVATLKLEHKAFVESGSIKGEVTDDLFVTGPYVKAKSIK